MWGDDSVPTLTGPPAPGPHGLKSQQAVYEVQTANGPEERALQQRTYASSWQELDTFLIDSEPSLILTNRATARSDSTAAVASSTWARPAGQWWAIQNAVQ